MNKIDEKINEIKSEKRIGLMGHIIAGFPNDDVAYEAGMGICNGGCDILEIQFPFSDPTADGPTIESASFESLANGFTVKKGFALAEKIVNNSNLAVLIMTYGNIIFKYGIKRFLNKAKSIGISGVIIPDLPPENDENINALCNEIGIYNIYVVAPGASEQRIKLLSNTGNGFLYTVVRRGITGRKTEIDNEATQWINLVKKNSSLPIAVGFGIQSSDQINHLKNKCEIAVAGSYFVKSIKEAFKNDKPIKDALTLKTKELLGK